MQTITLYSDDLYARIEHNPAICSHIMALFNVSITDLLINAPYPDFMTANWDHTIGSKKLLKLFVNMNGDLPLAYSKYPVAIAYDVSRRLIKSNLSDEEFACIQSQFTIIANMHSYKNTDIRNLITDALQLQTKEERYRALSVIINYV